MKYIVLLFTIAFMMMIASPALAVKKEFKTTSKANPTATINIKGVVIDQMTHEKLAGVSIQVGSSEEKIYSDPDGSFVIPNLEMESVTIKMKCISYKDKELTFDMKDLKKGKVKILLVPVLP